MEIDLIHELTDSWRSAHTCLAMHQHFLATIFDSLDEVVCLFKHWSNFKAIMIVAA